MGIKQRRLEWIESRTVTEHNENFDQAYVGTLSQIQPLQKPQVSQECVCMGTDGMLSHTYRSWWEVIQQGP